MKIYYNPRLKTLARKLRRKGVLSEALLWNCLKGKQMKGYRFMRQKPIDNFIVDFCCSKLRLIIEIDGASHEERFDTDRACAAAGRQRGRQVNPDKRSLNAWDLHFYASMIQMLERI